MHELEKAAQPLARQGSLHSLLGPVMFAGDAFVTRDGQVGLLLSVNGLDVDCLNDEVLEEHRDSLQSALKTFDERFRIYQYFVKRKHPGLLAPISSGPVVSQEAIDDRIEFLNSQTLYTTSIYFAVLLDPSGKDEPTGKRPELFYLMPSKITSALVGKAKAALHELRIACESFATQMAKVCSMRILSKPEAFRFLSRLINLDPTVADYFTLQSDFGVDVALIQSEVDLHPDGLTQSGYQLALLTMRKEPLDSADAARALQALPCEFILCTEYKRVPDSGGLAFIKSTREHRANNITPSSLVSVLTNWFQPDRKPTAKDQVIDPSALESVNRLGAVQVSLQNDGNYLGRFSLRLCLFSKDRKELDSAIAKALETFGPKEGKLFQERWGAFSTWLSLIPGNHRATVPSQWLWMQNGTYADFGQIFAPGGGNVINPHLKAPALTVATTRLETPCHLSLHTGGVGHAIGIGETRSGKSFLLNHLIDSSQQYADTHTCIWDIGGSYRQLTEVYGGSYIEMSADRHPFTINPFSLDPTNENLNFLSNFVQALYGPAFKDGQKDCLYDSIVKLYDLPRSDRRLSTLAKIVPLDLRPGLKRWIAGGQYESWFDHVHDNVTLTRFQTYDFRGMKKLPDVVQPLMMYLMRRFRQLEDEPSLAHALKLLVVDEAWTFLTTAQSRGEIVDAIKTGAKNNLQVVIGTQSVEDLEASGLTAQIEDNCPTQLLLAVKKSTVPRIQRMFALSTKEAEALGKLQAQRDVLVKQREHSQVLRFRHSAEAQARYKYSPKGTTQSKEISLSA